MHIQQEESVLFSLIAYCLLCELVWLSQAAGAGVGAGGEEDK